MRVQQWIRRFGMEERAAALVEFALVVPLVLVLLFAIVDFGRAINYWIDETHLANEAARYAIVDKNPGASSSQSLQRYIQAQAVTDELRDGTADAEGTVKTADRLRICIDFPGKTAATAGVGDPVRVRAEARYTWLQVIGLGVTSTPIRGTAIMRLEAPPTAYAEGCYPA